MSLLDFSPRLPLGTFSILLLGKLFFCHGVCVLYVIKFTNSQEKGDFPGLSENPFAKLLNVLFPSAKNVENGHFIRARLQNMRYMRDCARGNLQTVVVLTCVP